MVLGVVFVISVFFKKDCSTLTPENPYPQGTGEYAGFDWSMSDRGSRNCEAYNEPFIIGCMEYVKQEINYNKCINNQSVVKEYELVKPVLLFCKNGEDINGYCLSDW